MPETCPWCGKKAVNITTNDTRSGFDQRDKFMCVGMPSHYWRAGEGPEPEPPPSRIILATH